MKKLISQIRILIQYSTWKKVFNLIFTGIMIILRKSHSYNYPIVAYIEPTNLCNLNCPGCPTGIGISSNREKSLLSFNQFKTFVYQIKDFLFSINFSNWGEPLLNSNLIKMVEYAHEKNIRTCIDTNLNIELDESKANKLIKSGLDLLTVSLDGFSQKTYEKYRRRGDLNLVIKNIKLITKLKEKLNSNNPVIEIQFLKFSHNIHEVKLVREFAEKIGTRFVSKFGRRPNREFDIHPNEPYNPEYPACIFLWTIVTLNSDGGLAPCCLSYFKKDDFGKLIEISDFKHFWNSEEYKYSRALFSRIKNVRRSAIKLLKKRETPCLRCFYFTKKDRKYGPMGIL